MRSTEAALGGKDAQALGVVPNLTDYDEERRSFSWERARAELGSMPGDRGLNIAYMAVDRHADGALRGKVALRFVAPDGSVDDLDYGRLAAESNRFANVLAAVGVRPGETVFALLGRVPELYIAALGTLKHRAVFCPLFSAFGPEPVAQRLRLGDARVLVTTRAFYERKVAPGLHDLPAALSVLVIEGGGEPPELTLDLGELMRSASSEYEIGPTDPEMPALLHFTSGTTGTPKGALHVHAAVVGHHATARYALDLHPDDVFWCTADPGWVTGTSYGIVAPLTLGVTSIIDRGEFEAGRWYSIIEDQAVTVWYTAPTAIRMLMRAGPEAVEGHDLSTLRFVASVGEPLNPEAVLWAQRVWGLPVHDNWWQTETGGIMIANFAACEIRPGSMGRPLPGVEATVLARDADGELVVGDQGSPVEVSDPDTPGELALRPGWPSMFRAYLHQPDRYRKCFAGGWYRTGDLVRRDADGWYWFVARGDDVIKTAGHLVGPFEVESVLMEHDAVSEAGVVGIPDPVIGQRVKAFVLPAPKVEPSDPLRRELLGFARTRLGAVVAPKEIAFVDSLPHTRSGKIMRRLLLARELGQAEGDTSTLERP